MIKRVLILSIIIISCHNKNNSLLTIDSTVLLKTDSIPIQINKNTTPKNIFDSLLYYSTNINNIDQTISIDYLISTQLFLDSTKYFRLFYEFPKSFENFYLINCRPITNGKYSLIILCVTEELAGTSYFFKMAIIDSNLNIFNNIDIAGWSRDDYYEDLSPEIEECYFKNDSMLFIHNHYCDVGKSSILGETYQYVETKLFFKILSTGEIDTIKFDTIRIEKKKVR